ncbi:MAG: glycosyltransferase family 4 protein [Bacteroidales bacterium]|nr:glycosyltransferase family 4 protein [Bacteroidales bacterium]
MSRRLLVVGSNSIHVYNFIELVKENFDEVLLLTNEINPDKDMVSMKVDFRLGVQSLKTIKKIRTIAKDFQPCVVHIQQANTYAFLTALALKKRKIPLVLTAWGSDVLINPHKSFLLKKMLQYILNNIQVITADSNHVLNSAQKLVDKKLSLHNINFGIEMKECSKVEKENIIYSNRLHKELYNIDKIIHAFSKFVQTHDKWRLVIAGSGDETEVLKALVQKLQIDKDVEFVGFLNQEENYAYYCKSKIYISIPRSDSISISLVEAIVCGCVPYVSNLEANLELIKDKQNGFIEDDLENIDFEKFIQIDIEHFEKTRERLKVIFSKEYNKNRYVEIYDEVCQ